MLHSAPLGLLSLLCILSGIDGGKVLVFPLDGSHWVNMKVLIEELHSRGHNVTVIRASNSWYIKEEEGSSIWNRLHLEYEIIMKFKSMHEDMMQMIERMLEDNEIMKAIQDTKYDVVLADPAAGGGAILAYKFIIPLVFNVRWTIQGEGHFALAPSLLSYVPVPGPELTDKMSFLQRVNNVLTYLFTRFQIAVVTDPIYIPFCLKHFGPSVNYFSLFSRCRYLEFVQSSGKHGVIVMSLGTLITQLPQDVTSDIAAAFAQLPQKVIWRYTGPRTMTLGTNTLLLDWLPQNDLLGHPQIKAFVAHGGTSGVQEAIYHGVPILGVPLVVDQPDNLFRMEAKRTAKIVDIATLDRTVFLEALKEVLHNTSYKENMQRLSKLHHDQPMKPLDRASFRMSWIEYHSIDVILSLTAALLIFAFLFIYVIQYLFRVLFKKKVKRA
uniref:UDP-glucuronosyltransferase n=1 Tax=Cyprinus carpio TaxID=7962 RepID=A0A8C1YLW7_CYPCA